jgi:hypothetical protein
MKTAQQHQSSAFFSLIAEEIRQTSQHNSARRRQ